MQQKVVLIKYDIIYGLHFYYSCSAILMALCSRWPQARIAAESISNSLHRTQWLRVVLFCGGWPELSD